MLRHRTIASLDIIAFFSQLTPKQTTQSVKKKKETSNKQTE